MVRRPTWCGLLSVRTYARFPVLLLLDGVQPLGSGCDIGEDLFLFLPATSSVGAVFDRFALDSSDSVWFNCRFFGVVVIETKLLLHVILSRCLSTRPHDSFQLLLSEALSVFQVLLAVPGITQCSLWVWEPCFLHVRSRTYRLVLTVAMLSVAAALYRRQVLVE